MNAEEINMHFSFNKYACRTSLKGVICMKEKRTKEKKAYITVM